MPRVCLRHASSAGGGVHADGTVELAPPADAKSPGYNRPSRARASRREGTNLAHLVVDADAHVLEPPDLWERYMDPGLRDRAPC